MAEELETNLQEGLPAETNNETVQESAPEQTSQTDTQNTEAKKPYIKRQDRQREDSDKVIKQLEWLRSQQDRKFNELQKRFEAVTPIVESYNKYQQTQKQAELTKLSKENPAEYQKALIEQAKQEILAGQNPQQPQNSTPELGEKTAEEHVNYLRETYGQEILEPMAPLMGQILQATAQQYGPNIAKQLASYPDALMHMAIGQTYMEQYKGLKSQQAQGKVNQQRAQNFAKGTAKPNSAPVKATSYDQMSDADLKKAAYAEIAKRHSL